MFLYGCKLESDYLSIIITGRFPSESRIAIFHKDGTCNWEWVYKDINEDNINKILMGLHPSGYLSNFGYSYNFIMSRLKKDDREHPNDQLPDWFISNLMLGKLLE